jgi:hypothetical protein
VGRRKEREGLYRLGVAAVSKGGRSVTVGQPPFGAAVGHLPPLASAVGAKLACHVADQSTAVASSGCQVLTATDCGGRSLPPLETAAGAQPPWQTTV